LSSVPRHRQTRTAAPESTPTLHWYSNRPTKFRQPQATKRSKHRHATMCRIKARACNYVHDQNTGVQPCAGLKHKHAIMCRIKTQACNHVQNQNTSLQPCAQSKHRRAIKCGIKAQACNHVQDQSTGVHLNAGSKLQPAAFNNTQAYGCRWGLGVGHGVWRVRTGCCTKF
jgi:hypothetical protein